MYFAIRRRDVPATMPKIVLPINRGLKSHTFPVQRLEKKKRGTAFIASHAPVQRMCCFMQSTGNVSAVDIKGNCGEITEIADSISGL